MTVALQILAVLFAALFLARVINLIVSMVWYQHPKPPGTTVDVGGRRVYYTLKGDKNPTIVLETAMGTASAEWWMIQDELARNARVLTYDRAGYGWSAQVDERRTGEAVATELKQLLDELEIKGPLVLVGYSLGGLFVNQFCRLFPEIVGGVVFVDPMSPNAGRFKQELPPLIFRRSGVDKSRGLRMQSWLNGFGITRVMKPAILKSEQFSPYRALPAETKKVIWNHFLLPQMPGTGLSEYLEAQNPSDRDALCSAAGFPQVPLAVVTHSSERMAEQMARVGRIAVDDARRVEALWQDLIKGHTSLAPGASLVVANQSGHQVHLEQPDVLIKAILEVVDQVRRL